MTDNKIITDREEMLEAVKERWMGASGCLRISQG
jgi:hypothetical protein